MFKKMQQHDRHYGKAAQSVHHVNAFVAGGYTEGMTIIHARKPSFSTDGTYIAAIPFTTQTPQGIFSSYY
ncbi:hypothetical protein M5E88_10905 [Akkermansia muciniphila]|nr:hypothetical protein M5E88_10905 [Akkermansia muciniphila]